MKNFTSLCLMVLVIMFTNLVMADEIRYSSKARVQARDGGVVVYDQKTGQRHDVSLKGYYIPPSKQAAVNKYLQDRYGKGNSTSVRTVTDRYGQSTMRMGGNDFIKDLQRKGLVRPE